MRINFTESGKKRSSIGKSQNRRNSVQKQALTTTTGRKDGIISYIHESQGNRYVDNLIEPQMYQGSSKNQRRAQVQRRSLDSDIEFLLSTSNENTRNEVLFLPSNREGKGHYEDDTENTYGVTTGKCLRTNTHHTKHEQNESLENRKNKTNSYIQNENNEYLNTIKSIYNESVNHSNTKYNEPVSIEKVLQEKEEVIKEVLYSMPNYFFTLKQEYLNTKNRQEKVINDYTEQAKVNQTLKNRVDSLIKESNEKSELILRLTTENEALKNKQCVLDSFKEETQGYIEVLKRDGEEKSKELAILARENTELKCKETKGTYERERLDKEIKETQRTHERLFQQKDLIKEELNSLQMFVDTAFKKFLNSGIYKQIEKLSTENWHLMHCFYFFKACEVEMQVVGSVVLVLAEQVRKGQVMYRETVKEFEKEFWCLKRQVEERKKETKSILEFCERIREEAERILKQSICLLEKAKRMKDLMQQDCGKTVLLETISRQKNEIETQREFYERQVKELNRKLEEQEDVWDVFE